MLGARNHARVVVPLMAAVIEEAGITPAGLERVILADGPGSFTGLRVATALVKGLAAAGGLRVKVTPSLLGRAAGAVPPGGGLVLAAAAALRGEIYAGWYRFIATGAVTTVHPARALDWEAVRSGDRPDLIVGDAPDDSLEALGRQWQVPVVGRESCHADARVLLRLDGVPGGTAEILTLDRWEPTYGRPAEAQARWERDHGRALPDPSRSPG
jgi:tRNA threonylcarbamoyl adenosine modification protein YeaZ